MAEKRKRSARLGVFGAYAEGLKYASRTFAFAAPFILIYGLIGSGCGYYAFRLYNWAKSAETATVELAMQSTGALAVVLTLFSVLQFMKRARASRLSWFPAIFWIPSVLVTGMFAAIHNGVDNGQIAMIFITLPWYAWNLLWQSIGGAALAIVAIRLAEGVRKDAPATFGELTGEMVGRTAEVAAPMAGRVHAVNIGIQLLIPGIFYALQFAFTAMVAVLEPEARALTRSGQLTWAIRGKIFRVLAVWLLVGQLSLMGVAYALETPEAVMSSLMDGRALSLTTLVVQEWVWALVSWVCQLALYALYIEQTEREKRRKQRQEKRGRKGAAAADSEAAGSNGAPSTEAPEDRTQDA